MPRIKITRYDGDVQFVDCHNVRLLDNGWVKVWQSGEDVSDFYPPNKVLKVVGGDSNIYYGNP